MFQIQLWIFATVIAVTSAQVKTMPLHIFRHFHDQSYTSRQYACSEEERECFKGNQLLYLEDGKCYSVGERGPCKSHETFYADKKVALRPGGHLRGTCKSVCKDAAHAPLAVTGKCMSKSDVEKEVCRSDWYLHATKDAFGQWICEWTHLPCRPQNESIFFNTYDGSYDGVCSPPNIFRTSGVYRRSNNDSTMVYTDRPSDHPLRAYFVAKDLLEREFPCSEEERECLKHGRVLHSDGNCYRPREYTGKCEPGQTFHLDEREATRDGGHLQGTCRSLCRGYASPLAETGMCFDHSTVWSQMCRYQWGMTATQDDFGRLVCACNADHNDPPATPAPRPPATTPGHCRAPDFSKPTTTPNIDVTLNLGFVVPCSEKEFACLQKGLVRVDGKCHALRTRGPCAQGRELVLDKWALARARLQLVCAERPCPEGSVRLPADGSCLTYEQVIARLCPRNKIALDEFGGWQCSYSADFPGNLSSIVRNPKEGSCELPDKYGYGERYPIAR